MKNHSDETQEGKYYYDDEHIDVTYDDIILVPQNKRILSKKYTLTIKLNKNYPSLYMYYVRFKGTVINPSPPGNLKIHSIKEYNPKLTHLERVLLGLKNLNLCFNEDMKNKEPCNICHSPYWWEPIEANDKDSSGLSNSDYAEDINQWTNTWSLQYWFIPKAWLKWQPLLGPKKLNNENFEEFYKRCSSLAEKRDLDGPEYNDRIDAFLINKDFQCYYYVLKNPLNKAILTDKLIYSNKPIEKAKYLKTGYGIGQVKKYVGDTVSLDVIKNGLQQIVEIKCPSGCN